MPTGGAAVMLSGENLLYLARKEQCLALGTQLRGFKITDYKIYRIFPSVKFNFYIQKMAFFQKNLIKVVYPLEIVLSQLVKIQTRELLSLVDKQLMKLNPLII